MIFEERFSLTKLVSEAKEAKDPVTTDCYSTELIEELWVKFLSSVGVFVVFFL